jgi:hypothetical protein
VSEAAVHRIADDRRRWARRAGDPSPAPHAVPDVRTESRQLRNILRALVHSPTVVAVRRRAQQASRPRA